MLFYRRQKSIRSNIITNAKIHCLTVLQIPHSHIPYGEPGSGSFSSKVLDTLDSMKELAPIALDCVRSLQVTPSSVFTIADYGCADGGTSMPLIYSCVEELRKLHGSELEILIFYEDQPTNDFTSLFAFLQGTHSPQTNNQTFNKFTFLICKTLCNKMYFGLLFATTDCVYLVCCQANSLPMNVTDIVQLESLMDTLCLSALIWHFLKRYILYITDTSKAKSLLKKTLLLELSYPLPRFPCKV